MWRVLSAQQTVCSHLELFKPKEISNSQPGEKCTDTVGVYCLRWYLIVQGHLPDFLCSGVDLRLNNLPLICPTLMNSLRLAAGDKDCCTI